MADITTHQSDGLTDTASPSNLQSEESIGSQNTEPAPKRRKGRNGAGWSKKKDFVEDPYERKKKNEQKISSLAKTLSEWYHVTHTPALFMAFCNGAIKFYGNTDAMKQFCKDYSKEFTSALRKGLRPNDELFKEFPMREDWKTIGVKKKRKLIRDIVQFDSSCTYVSWVESQKPTWWPDVEFGNPSGAKPFCKKTCDNVIESFLANGNACFEVAEEEEMCVIDDVNDFDKELNIEVDTLRRSNYSDEALDLLSNRFADLEGKVEILKSLKEELEKAQSDAFNDLQVEIDEIDIQYRHHVEGRYEPVKVVADGNCLYRSVSRALFGTEEKWRLLKLGGLLTLDVNIDETINELETHYGGDLGHIIGEFPNEDLTEIIQKRLNEMALPGIYGGILELISLSIFARVHISLTVGSNLNLYQHFSRVYNFGQDVWAYVKMLVVGNETPNHFVPLMLCRHHTSRSFSERQCWARRHCKVTYGDFINCKNCNLQYHKFCVLSSPSTIYTGESCGCDRVTKVPEKLNWLSSVDQVEEKLSQTDVSELKKYLQQLLQQKIKCLRLQNFFRHLMGPSIKPKNWFSSLQSGTIDILKRFIHNLNLSTTNLSRKDKDIQVLHEEVLLPETIVFITACCTDGMHLTIERWIEEQK